MFNVVVVLIKFETLQKFLTNQIESALSFLTALAGRSSSEDNQNSGFLCLIIYFWCGDISLLKNKVKF